MKSFKVLKTSMKGQSILSQGIDNPSDINIQLPTEIAELFAAAPFMLETLERCISALRANGAPNCEAVKEAKAAINKARGIKS